MAKQIDGNIAIQGILAKEAGVDIDDARKMTGADLEMRKLELMAERTVGSGGDVSLMLLEAGEIALTPEDIEE